MKKIAPLFLGLAVCAWAADFWQTRPYTEWSDKETQKIETNSPWSKPVPLSVGGGGGGPDTSRGKRGAGGVDSQTGMGVDSSSRPNQREVASDGQSGGGSAPTIYVSWRSALAFRQAVAKAKFGDETATSPEAKKIVEEEPKSYLIMISGLSGRALRGSDKLKESLMQNSSLIVKGKNPVQATDVQVGGNEQRPVLVFVFPKTDPITLDDKEVEFSTKLGSIGVKQKFHLKDMVLNGKLDL